nr:MAG TPA: hypothetical protein [Caudoviricetes sp.]
MVLYKQGYLPKEIARCVFNTFKMRCKCTKSRLMMNMK